MAINTIDLAMSNNPLQMDERRFELLAEILRSRNPAKKAARLVLLDGMQIAAAAKATEHWNSSLSRTLKAFRTLDAKISSVYGPAKQGDAPPTT